MFSKILSTSKFDVIITELETCQGCYLYTRQRRALYWRRILIKYFETDKKTV